MIDAAIFIGLICGAVVLVTYGLQLLIFFAMLAWYAFLGLLQVAAALCWCVYWVFDRRGAMEALNGDRR